MNSLREGAVHAITASRVKNRNRTLHNVSILLLILANVSSVNALFFKLKQGQSRCFIELFRKNEVVLVQYRSPDQAEIPIEPEKLPYHVGPKMQVKESKGTAIFEGKCDKEGRFAFTAREDTEHSLCFSVEGHSLGQEYRVHINIMESLQEDGVGAVSEIAKVEHLGALELKVRKLQQDIKRIKKEQQYFRMRELRFKETVDSTNFRSQWLSVLQIVAMFVVTGLHLSYLSHYFVKKKIV